MKFIKQLICCNHRYLRIRLFFSLAFWLLLVSPLMAEIEPIESKSRESEYLKYISGQKTFFADKEYELQWMEGKDVWDGADELVVRLNYINQPVLERQLKFEFPIKVKLKFPAVRDGVVAQTLLTIAAVKDGKMQTRYYQETFYFYPQDESVQWTKAFQDLHIGVLDQTENQTLTQFLKNNGIPYTQLYSFSDFTGKWLIVSGGDFNNDFFIQLNQLLNRGVSILIIPPMRGNFIFPEHEPGSRFILSDETIIQDIDKKLNLSTIHTGADNQRVLFIEKVIGDEVGIELAVAKGYSWMERQNGNARMIFLGSNILEIYESNPSVKAFIRQILLENKIK